MKNERGVSAVEFAIVLPLLILVLFGIIEFSLILYDKAMLTNASREGARAGIVAQLPRVTPGEIDGIVKKYCQNHLVTFGSSTPITTVIPGVNFGDDLTVSVAYTYDFLLLPKFGFSKDYLTLTATTVMRME